MGYNFPPGDFYTTDRIRGLLNNAIAAVEDPHPEYLEIWVINPQPAAQNDQDPLFVLERTFHSGIPDRPWLTQTYNRRGNRLSLFVQV